VAQPCTSLSRTKIRFRFRLPTFTWAALSVVNVVADATGFNFSAVARSTPFSFQLGATDVAQTPNVSALLTINIVLPAITGLTFLSP